ncbi:lactate utilization protein [Desulfonatronovibrio magnus]|uniref:lactate utilization protein n=1 Tax=Desulfonatronovibrio magnus TaxID=698827 RepID=UPI0005EB0E63|nr:lactate utilization protein [Desulfonatronovibrio magnus]
MQEEMVNTFTAKAEAVSAVVRKVSNMQQALEYAVKICDEKEACRLLLAGCELAVSNSAAELCQFSSGEKFIAAPGLDRDALTGLQALAKERDIKVVSSGLRKYASGLDMGLAVADLGLAETGTLVLECSSEDLRLSTMLCEINILVLPVSRMRTGTDEAEEELAAMMKNGSAYLSFITGASRTADIERVLALGVHGPLELHILLWEDD